MKLYIDPKEINAFKKVATVVMPTISTNDKIEEKKTKLFSIVNTANGGVVVSVNPDFFMDMAEATSQHIGMLYGMYKAMFHGLLTMAESIGTVMAKYSEEKKEEKKVDDLFF